MDFELEIINEEDDCPNHLFESIMDAMNSMKEATADKIYQKIQRDGETNYSKPQVDKALANALNYGIFEVNNNCYRVRDDILENEDTAYWKLHQEKDRTPFEIQERISEKQFGLKLDPERDNQKFRKIPVTDKQECPHCGKIKILKPKEKSKETCSQKKSKKLNKIKKKKKSKKLSAKKRKASYRNAGSNRKKWCGRHGENFHVKKKTSKKESKGKECTASETLLKDFWTEVKDLREKKLFHSSPSDFWDSATEFKKKKISSRNEHGKARNQYLKLSEKHHNQYNSETNQHIGKSDWLESSDELQGTVIQSKNMLIIQPMNSLSFKSLGHTSYFT